MRVTKTFINAISKLNPKGWFGASSSGAKTVKPYNLLDRVDNVDIASFKNNPNVSYNPNATSYSYVKVGKNGDENFSREIYSFFDKDKKLLSRTFMQNGVPTRRQSIKYESTRRYLQEETFVSSGNGTFMGRSLGFWTFNKSEMRNVNITKSTNREMDVMCDTVTKQVLKNVDEFQYSYVQHPWILNGKLYRHNAKSLSADVKFMPDNFTISNVKAKGFELDVNDEFLKYRIVDPRSQKGLNYLHQYVLDKNGVGQLGVSVSTSGRQAGAIAGFEPAASRISYYDAYFKQSTTEAVNTVAHEGWHAFQFSLIGRAGYGRTEYERKAAEVLGELNETEKKAAGMLSIARSNYVPALHDKYGYECNQLERGANLAGKEFVEQWTSSPNNKFFDFFTKWERPFN